MEILHARSSTRHPGPLPKAARVAHKTGEISTVAHDAGVVYLPKRKPYSLVIPNGMGSQHFRPLATIALSPIPYLRP
jgi:beta-lactamase class A